MQEIIDKKTQQSGMALGGLGTGSVEICQNGELAQWHIFNMGKWAGENRRRQAESLYDYGQNVLPFIIRTKKAGDIPKVRKLYHDAGRGEFRSMMYSWHREVEKIGYEASFPVCRLRYIDRDLPVAVRSEFRAPFVPHDARLSGTPGFFADFTIENITGETVEVSLLCKLKNPVNRGLARRRLVNRVQNEPGRTSVVMQSSETKPYRQNGSLCLSMTGEDVSFIRSDFPAYFANDVLFSDYGVTEESYLFDFRESGRLPNLGTETFPDEIPGWTDEVIADMSMDSLKKALRAVLGTASAEHPYRRMVEINSRLSDDREEIIKFLRLMRNRFTKLHYDEKGKETWGDAALCSYFTLRPGEKQTVTAILSWYFPNHRSDLNRFVGHAYANWFGDAAEVNDFLYTHTDSVRTETSKFIMVLRDCNAETSMIDSWQSQLNTLIKCSWWSKKGEFGIWEGYGNCGFHTVDITYQGSFPLLSLFPELQLGQMEMGAKFQREDGRVHHFFIPDFESVDNGFDRVDMNPQFVLLVCRDYMHTGDTGYIKRLWKNIVKAMDAMELLDRDGDGLPDTDTARNTYDAWHFRGTPSYIAGLTLASLLAASRIAGDLGECTLRDRWMELFRKGSKSMVKKLWNGEYFALWEDGGEKDECCMTDQLSGAWYAALTGLDEILPDPMVRKTLKSILKYNYHPETGLINAAYPEGTSPTRYTYKNVQALANWSGIEFAFTSMLLENGMVCEAAEVSETVWERYAGAGRIFDHEECGDHYYRAMAGWTMLLSAAGFKPDMPRKTLAFTPPFSVCRAPWFACSGYGWFEKNKNRIELCCRSGRLGFEKLVLNSEFDVTDVSFNGRSILYETKKENGLVTLFFSDEVILTEESLLTVQ